ncbi:MAG: cytochrome-c peroxidase [Chitinophagales bacterium]|nr:cytochrome-c peroxidase [Chitinophagales bacterium]
MKKVIYLLSTIIVMLFFACQKDTPSPKAPQLVLPAQPFDYSNLNYPEHFQTSFLDFILGNNLVNNPITDEGATLGRVLFYDTKLSANDEVSCASCHHQENAFGDPNRFSTGFEGGLTKRHSMALSNTLYNRRFFWDLRANNLRHQVLLPIQDPLEMGSNLDSLVQELATTDYYPELFTAAFGNDSITSDKISNALAQFINSITSFNSKYDEGIYNDFANFTAEEELGRQLFFERGLNCNQCHASVALMNPAALNNGLTPDENDKGLMEFTGDPDDAYKFKTPSMRNIALSAPYMHDGRFETLEEVIEHYNSGVTAHPNLDDRVTTTNKVGGPPRQLNLTSEEKAALVAFLHTLTDEVMITDEKYSDPFQR